MIIPPILRHCISHNANDGVYRRLNGIYLEQHVPNAYLLNYLTTEKCPAWEAYKWTDKQCFCPFYLLSTRLIACCVIFFYEKTNLYCFRHAFNGSFTIHFFIGRINDEDPGEFMVRPNEVGFSGIFITTAEAVCANCDKQRARDFMYEDVVPITSTLVDYLDDNPISKDLIQEGTIRTIPNFEPANMKPFLKEHLKWRIVDTASNL